MPREIFIALKKMAVFSTYQIVIIWGKTIIALTPPFCIHVNVYLYFQAILNDFSNVKENIFHVRLFPAGYVS